MEDSRQSRKHVISLLLHCRQIAANVAKDGSSSRPAKGAGNLLPHFGHAQITPDWVVSKKNVQVIEQFQYLLTFCHLDCDLAEILPTLLAPFGTMKQNLIWLLKALIAEMLRSYSLFNSLESLTTNFWSTYDSL